MPDEPRPADPEVPATPRRAFLRLLALAPAAAGCATSSGAQAGAARPAAAAEEPEGDARQGGPDPAPPGAGDEDPLAPIRAYPLASDAEPAFVFRAVTARPGE